MKRRGFLRSLGILLAAPLIPNTPVVEPQLKGIDWSKIDKDGDLYKALTVGNKNTQMKVLSFKDHDIQLWKKLPKDSAYSTVEEYQKLVGML